MVLNNFLEQKETFFEIQFLENMEYTQNIYYLAIHPRNKYLRIKIVLKL